MKSKTLSFQPSRTFALSAFGLLVLSLVAFAVVVLVVYQVIKGNPEAVAEGLTTLQVLAGCIAAVAAGGAGSMAARDFGSRGLTSSQVSTVLAARKPNPAPVGGSGLEIPTPAPEPGTDL